MLANFARIDRDESEEERKEEREGITGVISPLFCVDEDRGLAMAGRTVGRPCGRWENEWDHRQ